MNRRRSRWSIWKRLGALGGVSARTITPAALNLGDCFAYALADVTGEPLLFKGEDFAHTDVEVA